MGSKRRSPVRMDEVHPHTCTIDVRRRVLAHVPFFSHLDVDSIDGIDRRSRVEDFEVGEAVHLAGDPADSIHIVATGTAKRSRPTLDGTEVLLDILRPGDHFGALPALGADRHADSVWALTPLCVLTFDIGAVDDILDEHPSVARAALAVVTRQLADAMDHIHRMSAANAEQRVAAVLAILADRTGRPEPRGLTLLDLPLSRDDLAGLTGLTSETVSRILAKLRRDEVIESGRQWVAVRDLEHLRELAVV